jgi:hypothetical protein
MTKLSGNDRDSEPSAQNDEQKDKSGFAAGMTKQKTDNGAIRRFWLRQNDEQKTGNGVVCYRKR